jgi:hypothetical protein
MGVVAQQLSNWRLKATLGIRIYDPGLLDICSRLDGCSEDHPGLKLVEEGRTYSGRGLLGGVEPLMVRVVENEGRARAVEVGELKNL